MEKAENKFRPATTAYPFAEIEQKWQERWDASDLFKAPDHPKKPYYVLVMFAYPSGDMHMGHFRNYIVGDAIARWKMMQGYEILHPYGWDAFGLPAENAAIKHKLHPRDWTLNNIRKTKATLQSVGISFDWSREVTSCLPDYYKWTQWMFVKLFENDLAYRKNATVNWCDTCNTVLANEQVDAEGRCWRCEQVVTKRQLEQWFFRITRYADRLLNGLDNLPGWLDSVRAMQRNWIGKSTGCRIDFTIEGTGEKLPIFTTRPDTIYGVTFMAIAPEAEIVNRLPIPGERRGEADEYIRKAGLRSDIDRTADSEDKDGVFTGCYAINPFSGEKVQLWIADYVLASYGTGAVMAVPAHDQRDFLFAKMYGIPIKVVIHPHDRHLEAASLTEAYTDYGVMVNSGPFDGKQDQDAIDAVTRYANERGIGGFETNYRLRDWLISRQRYWGCPIPIVYCDDCGTVAEKIHNLPVLLPEVDNYMSKGRSPLADVPEYINTTCPNCGKPAKRDADTMDTFVCSSWYLFRYADPHNDKEPFDPKKAAEWLPVDIYIGGTYEHATGHLLYYRFFNHFLKDIGYLQNDEPAVRLLNHGLVSDANGVPMSKSAGNIVSPLDVMADRGIDVARLAMYFAAPCGKEVLWSEEAIVGVERFVAKLYRLVADCPSREPVENGSQISRKQLSNSEWEVYVKLNQTIKKVTEDIDKLHFNTCIAAIMEFINDFTALDPFENAKLYQYALQRIIQISAPMTPHLSEELWEMFGQGQTIFKSAWPDFDLEAIVEDTITIVVQVNGKVRANLQVSPEIDRESLVSAARESHRASKFLEGKQIIKEIVVPGKLVNFVVK